jgi:branched-chain amino acid transport system ATP-binding protein
MMLQVRDLDVSYGRIRALTRVSFEVHAGEIVTLIGPNGAGKSTLLKAIAGILKPQAGSIRFAGEPIQGWRAEDIVPRGLVLVPEGRSTLKHMTVRENLVLGGYARRDQAGLAQDVERMIDRFPALRPRLGQKAGTLSGGEQQMLVIARALLARPALLMLDEPSLGLAPLVTAKIFAILRELKRDGVTVLLVEQNARQALRLADRAYVLENGRIVLEGADLAGNDRVREAYLGV